VRPSLQRVSRWAARWPGPPGPAIGVIGYHRVDNVEDSLAVGVRTFRTHMTVLAAERELRPVFDLDDALDRLQAGTAPRRAVVVTFDDAWADNHANALGPLVEHGVPATMFVPSRLLGAPGHMSRRQLSEMAAAGVAIGAHSRSHAALPACGDAELEAEVRGSREDLEDLLGIPVTRFAYPTGLYNGRVLGAVARAGFRTAVTTDRGWARHRTDPLRLPRSIMEEFDPPTFRAALDGGLNWLRPVEAIRARIGR
jgi:peptidoglycan/xylan/chitin deacetylase (PgdA/CDA1 family)